MIANGLHKKEFRYLLLSYTGYGFGLNVLNRVSKIGILGRKISDFCLNQGQGMSGQAAPPLSRIYRVSSPGLRIHPSLLAVYRNFTYMLLLFIVIRVFSLSLSYLRIKHFVGRPPLIISQRILKIDL